MAVIYWHSTGPHIEWLPPSEIDRSVGTLLISDLNPEVKLKWTWTRGQLLLLAWRCLVAALTGIGSLGSAKPKP